MANSAGKGGKSVAYQKKLNESNLILRQPLLLISIILTILLLILFVVYPLVRVLIHSMTDAEGNFSLDNLITILSTSRYLAVFGRMMLLGVVVAFLSPPFILSLSIILLFGKQGFITKELLGITGNNVYGMGSLMVQTMSFSPSHT